MAGYKPVLGKDGKFYCKCKSCKNTVPQKAKPVKCVTIKMMNYVEEGKGTIDYETLKLTPHNIQIVPKGAKPGDPVFSDKIYENVVKNFEDFSDYEVVEVPNEIFHMPKPTKETKLKTKKSSLISNLEKSVNQDFLKAYLPQGLQKIDDKLEKEGNISLKIELVPYVISFYILEELNIQVPKNSFRHGIVKLRENMDEYREEFITSFMDILYDYLTMIVMGEARHYHRAILSSFKYKYKVQLLDDKGKELFVPSDSFPSIERNEAFTQGKDYNPEIFLPELERLFTIPDWIDSFGGDKWASIVKTAMLKGTTPNSTFVDMAIHCVHNGGNIFDKSAIVEMNPNVLKAILDCKFESSILLFDNKNIPTDVKAGCNCSSCQKAIKNQTRPIKVTKKVMRLAKRAGNLISPDFNNVLEYLTCRELSYTPIKWGKKGVKVKIEEKTEKEKGT